MVVGFLFTKIKHFLLFFVNVFRRIFCCFRRRRRSSLDIVPLTHVGVVSNSTEIDENWQWEENLKDFEPKTVQDHIDLYRKKKQDVVSKTTTTIVEEQLDLFEDMTPNITKQTKVLINNNNNQQYSNTTNRLSFVDTTPVESGELREWEENNGWEGETLDWDAQEALKAKKRQDRERRMWEQQQKRLEQRSRSLGERVTTTITTGAAAT